MPGFAGTPFTRTDYLIEILADLRPWSRAFSGPPRTRAPGATPGSRPPRKLRQRRPDRTRKQRTTKNSAYQTSSADKNSRMCRTNNEYERKLRGPAGRTKQIISFLDILKCFSHIRRLSNFFVSSTKGINRKRDSDRERLHMREGRVCGTRHGSGFQRRSAVVGTAI